MRGFDGLAEFVPRKARVELVELLRDDGWSVGEIADSIGVTVQAVYKWLNPEETHPSNLNLQKLLELAFASDSNRTLGILTAEADEFQRLIRGFQLPV